MQTSHGNPSSVPKYRYSKELQTAVEDDARRKAIDAAKKRAAAQNVDYPTFAALVSMAHVKPFERTRRQEVSVKRSIPPSSPAWSFDANGKLVSSRQTSGDSANSLKGSAEHLLRASPHLIKSIESERPEEEHRIPQETSDPLCRQGIIHKQQLPITSDAFKREWRRSSELREKLQLLLAVSDDLHHIFKVEIAPSLLTDIVSTLCWWKQYSTEGASSAPSTCLEETITETVIEKPSMRAFDANLACCILESLIKCGRFSLSLKLAGSKLQLAVHGLINDIIPSSSVVTNASSTDGGITIDMIESLRSMYTI